MFVCSKQRQRLLSFRVHGPRSISDFLLSLCYRKGRETLNCFPLLPSPRSDGGGGESPRVKCVNRYQRQRTDRWWWEGGWGERGVRVVKGPARYSPRVRGRGLLRIPRAFHGSLIQQVAREHNQPLLPPYIAPRQFQVNYGTNVCVPILELFPQEGTRAATWWGERARIILVFPAGFLLFWANSLGCAGKEAISREREGRVEEKAHFIWTTPLQSGHCCNSNNKG